MNKIEFEVCKLCGSLGSIVNTKNNFICFITTIVVGFLTKPKAENELVGLVYSLTEKPKETEKKKFGEVFTPMKLVFEMIDKLDEYYKKNNGGKSIFSNKNLKWFDPANGMGNFPIAIYLRLMEGLKLVIKDEKERKKHILENMLYMSELNKKNVLICKQIFDINNEYKLNLYNGDSLDLDTKKEWKIEKFDVIIGNPPYNKGGIRSHTGKQLGEKNETIWTKFIEKSFDWLKSNGFIVFINPLSWLKKSHSLHNTMLEKYIIWIKLWDNIKSLATINGKIPISLFILQNKLNIEKKKTEIISEIQSKKIITLSNEYLNKDYTFEVSKIKIDLSLKSKSPAKLSTQDTTMFVDALENDKKVVYKYQITTISSSRFNNLKFEPTSSAATAARLGKAPVDMVMGVLKEHHVKFTNSNKDYPQSAAEFKKQQEEYVKMFNAIKSKVETNIGSEKDFVSNMTKIFMETPQLANTKLMQLRFVYEMTKLPKKDMDRIMTKITLLAQKKGEQFGPFGKLY